MEEFIEYTADAVVVGAGHAGCEAALALARTGMNTVMLTLNLDSIGFIPCNPSIGGTAKGHLVREIDALGGEMGRNADKTALQIRMLNVGKGTAVQSLRAQSDKNAYHREMKKTLEHTKNLRILQGEAAEILVENGACKGVKTTYGGIILCRAVVLCTGVYLNAETITGDEIKKSGPNGFAAATALTKNLVELGFSVRRFKTGTPARLDGRTVDYSACEIQEGDEEIYPFSFLSSRPPKNKLPCYLTYTNQRTHEIILENLDRSPLYNGTIQSTGPRYCPSIETKVVRFKYFWSPKALTLRKYTCRACPRPCRMTSKGKCMPRLRAWSMRTSCATATPSNTIASIRWTSSPRSNSKKYREFIRRDKSTALRAMKKPPRRGSWRD